MGKGQQVFGKKEGTRKKHWGMFLMWAAAWLLALLCGLCFSPGAFEAAAGKETEEVGNLYAQ